MKIIKKIFCVIGLKVLFYKMFTNKTLIFYLCFFYKNLKAYSLHSGHTYYKMSNIDNRIANADQLITQDVERFCNSLVDLYSNLSKVVTKRVLS